VVGQEKSVGRAVRALADVGIRVSLFIDPSPHQLEAARRLGAPVVELHTGTYCEGEGPQQHQELARLRAAARLCQEFGLECHAGHGLTYDNVAPVAAIPNVAELNIGHFLVGEAIFIGLPAAVQRMRDVMDRARAAA
jgi:pyridoxine 5-phosphate synthase